VFSTPDFKDRPGLFGIPDAAIGQQVVFNVDVIRCLSRSAEEVATTYCAYVDPDHSVERHQAIERLIARDLRDIVSTRVDEIHRQIETLRRAGYGEHGIDEQLAEEASA
jgi:hypothetical protein